LLVCLFACLLVCLVLPSINVSRDIRIVDISKTFFDS
jgi:hypothetical protein